MESNRMSDVVIKATTPETQKKLNSLTTGPEGAAPSALLAKPAVKTTDSGDIIITDLPIVSKETLEHSVFRRICHALKYRFMDDNYTKHRNFIKRLNSPNGNKDIRRPIGMPPICICYMLNFTYVSGEQNPQLVITFLPSMSYPSAHIRCTSDDPFCDRRTGSVENPVYWRPLPKRTVDNIVKIFSGYCAMLIKERINLVWDNTPEGKPLHLF